MSLYRRGETWWIVIHHQGQRIRESTGTADKAEAQRLHDQRKAALWSERRTDNKTLADAASAWLSDSERSIKDRYRLRSILELLDADTPLSEINTALIVDAFGGQSPGSYTRNRSLLVAVLNTARLRGWLEELPTIPTKSAPAPRIRFLSAQEWARLQTALPPHLLPMARFAVATGLRRANVTHLEWSQVDLRRRVAWIHADQAKARKPIGVPLSDDAMAVLRSQLGQHPRYVFTYHGEPQHEISKGWKAALKRAGIEQSFRWHDLRHTWASWHIMSGTPMEVLQKLGGWSSLAMVMRYAHLAPDHLASYAGNAKPYETCHQSVA